MYKFRLIAPGFSMVALSFGLMSADRAQAASDACSLIGMFDSRAKAVCEASQHASQRERASTDQNTARDIGSSRGDGERDDRGDDRAALAPPAPPASGFHRYDVAGNGLFLDLPGTYPQGYAPRWTLNATTPQAIIMDRYNRLNHGPQGTETLFVRIVEEQGRTALEFSRRGTLPCVADIVGLPQVITGTPKRFRLANFRYANNKGPQCQRKLGSTAPWQGSLTLSASPDGDLRLSLLLNLAMDSGAPWFEFTARDLPFANQMTPQMAIADVGKKKQAILANAAREQQAAADRAAEIARINAMPRANPVYARQVAGYVQADSRGWASNRLDSGSIGNVRVYSGSIKSGGFILRAEYSYNGGSPGWVVAKYSGGQFVCIQFWDSMVGCRGLRKPGEGQQTLASILESGMSGSGNSGSGQRQDENARFDMWRQNNINQGLNDNGTPK